MLARPYLSISLPCSLFLPTETSLLERSCWKIQCGSNDRALLGDGLCFLTLFVVLFAMLSDSLSFCLLCFLSLSVFLFLFPRHLSLPLCLPSHCSLSLSLSLSLTRSFQSFLSLVSPNPTRRPSLLPPASLYLSLTPSISLSLSHSPSFSHPSLSLIAAEFWQTETGS